VGTTVGNGPIERYVPGSLQDQMKNAAWCCSNAACDVVYYNMFEQTVRAADLLSPVYPYDSNAPICACFGFTLQDVEGDAEERSRLESEPCWLEVSLPRLDAKPLPSTAVAACAKCSDFIGS
jgi:hypothetical protein